ncbi:MAG: hypothetical protein E6K88_07070 [Thaumarchaeota archaeon]|nr:MAG: hypothetical protein E6K88_07070 [Nitrososphaerota archaeon]TLY11118.1 MAG: hypothetical protein E6K85_02095 [Nitrososphaerota archaeon]
MRSSVVLFILTFAVLGLLLGVAAVTNTGQEGQRDKMKVDENITANVTHGSESGSKVENSGK